MEDLKETIINYSGKNLEERKSWYSPAAEAYDRARPRYPLELIHRVMEVAQLSSDSKILEVGCGPGTATVDFARFGCSMVCLEPNPDFYRLAQRNCQFYPHVEIQHTSFEEWTVLTGEFDAVLAATSFHWIPPEIGYPKAAKALRADGSLILLWNKELQPPYEVYQSLLEVYQLYAPFLARYEDRETQEEVLQGLGQIVIDSGQFQDLVSEQFQCRVTYSVDEYLTLLSTYSPYLELTPQRRNALFEGLRDKIEQEWEGSLQLSYLSAFHIARLM